MRRDNDLGRDPIGRLVFRIAVPSMMAQLVSVLYSIVDRMYIGNIPVVGDVALAGVGVCGPVVTMVGSVASLVGLGGAPLMSIRMGEGDMERARSIMANCFMMLCVLSVVLVAALLPLREPMLILFGASDVTLPYANGYFSVYLTGTVFALLSTGMSQFIICQGFARQAMISVMLGAGLNIALDPVFIFVLGMGVEGAALATVISQLGSCIFVLAFLFGKRAHVRISFGRYRLSVIRSVLMIGFTPFAIIAVDNVMIIAMNAVLQRYGGAARGDMLITCVTIAQSFMLVVTMPLGGISGGTQTILSFNYGARNTQRIREAQKRIFMLCVGYTAFMLAMAWLCGGAFVRLFTQDEQVGAQALWAIRVFTLALIPLGLQYEIVDGFTAVGQVRYSLPLSFWRKLTYFVALFALPAAFGAEAAFFAEPISDVLGPAVSIVVYLTGMKRILSRREQLGTGGASD